MKRLISLFFGVLLLISTLAHAQVDENSNNPATKKTPLGIGNLAIKLDHLQFTDSVLEDVDLERARYIGIEGFAKVSSNLYLGVETGYAKPTGSINYLGVNIETELTYVPVELNLKYVVNTTPNLVFDLGAGASYSYVKEEVSTSYRGAYAHAREKDWLWGGQVFVAVNYTINRFFIGVNGKFQITEDFEDSRYSYNNWRVGGQVGFKF